MPGGNKKYGRNEKKCKRYKDENRKEKNKKRRMQSTLNRQPNNHQLASMLK